MIVYRSIYTVSQKVPTFKLSVTLSNLTRLTLGMLLHYLGKLKIQIFCRYSAHTEENANTCHFKCTSFNSSMRVTVYAEYNKCDFIKILFWSLNIMLIVNKHHGDVCCDEFPVTQIDRKSKQVKEH